MLLASDGENDRRFCTSLSACLSLDLRVQVSYDRFTVEISIERYAYIGIVRSATSNYRWNNVVTLPLRLLNPPMRIFCDSEVL